MKKIVTISGMHCEHCSTRVQEALEKIKGVKKVKVNLDKKEAIINGEVDDNVIKDTITTLGYEVENISEKKGLF